ncbi:hypothetical protein BU15DRAFT_63584 [Melanogaster broomeanus]|nr:hypothetical protein BU15DRAFT_63584 [Melanogaster broomeanus]
MQTEYMKPRPGSYNDHMQYPLAMQRTLAPSHATKTTGAHATRCSRRGEPPSHMQPHQVVHTQCDAATITIYNNDTHSLWTTQQTLNPSHATDPMEPQRRVAHTLHSTATTRKTALLQITDNARKFSAGQRREIERQRKPRISTGQRTSNMLNDDHGEELHLVVSGDDPKALNSKIRNRCAVCGEHAQIW